MGGFSRYLVVLRSVLGQGRGRAVRKRRDWAAGFLGPVVCVGGVLTGHLGASGDAPLPEAMRPHTVHAFTTGGGGWSLRGQETPALNLGHQVTQQPRQPSLLSSPCINRAFSS